MKSGDLFFLFVILGLSLVGVFWFRNKDFGSFVSIKVENEISQYPLNQEKSIFLQTKNGHYNRVVIENGSVYMEEADCPNQICVHHKPISKHGESIVCIPNGVTLWVEGEAQKDMDN